MEMVKYLFNRDKTIMENGVKSGNNRIFKPNDDQIKIMAVFFGISKEQMEERIDYFNNRNY